jgi:hypothetical protein
MSSWSDWDSGEIRRRSAYEEKTTSSRCDGKLESGTNARIRVRVADMEAHGLPMKLAAFKQRVSSRELALSANWLSFFIVGVGVQHPYYGLNGLCLPRGKSASLPPVIIAALKNSIPTGVAILILLLILL